MVIALGGLGLVAGSATSAQAQNQYQQTNLISDLSSLAPMVDSTIPRWLMSGKWCEGDPGRPAPLASRCW
jgi:hypothetical protein